MNLTALAVAFGVVFAGELPDKTMFASLVMASRGRPRSVWLGAATAFLLHVTIAVTVGAGVLHVLPDRAVEFLVAALFLFGAVVTFRSRNEQFDEGEISTTTPRVAVAAFLVVFVAEWGDLTQILTANLAARYDSPLSVALGALVALWTVAGLAVVVGRGILRYVPLRVVRLVSAGALTVLSLLSLWSALR